MGENSGLMASHLKLQLSPLNGKCHLTPLPSLFLNEVVKKFSEYTA